MTRVSSMRFFSVVDMPWTQRVATFALLILSVICIPAPSVRLTPVDVTNAFATARLQGEIDRSGEDGSRCGGEERRGLGADGRELPLCHSRESRERPDWGAAITWSSGGTSRDLGWTVWRSCRSDRGRDLFALATLQLLKVRLEI
jgi:hypothetical protein